MFILFIIVLGLSPLSGVYLNKVNKLKYIMLMPWSCLEFFYTENSFINVLLILSIKFCKKFMLDKSFRKFYKIVYTNETNLPSGLSEVLLQLFGYSAVDVLVACSISRYPKIWNKINFFLIFTYWANSTILGYIDLKTLRIIFFFKVYFINIYVRVFF